MAKILDFIKQCNWVDVFVVIVLMRTTYIAIKNGIFISFFKLLGTLFACYLSLHYYIRLADLLKKYIPNSAVVSLEAWDFFSVLILMLVGHLVFVVLRETFFRFIKAETVSFLNRWGAMILGVARGFIFVSLVIFLLSIPLVNYLTQSVKDSFSGKHVIKVSVGVYSYFWKNLVAKFMPTEKFNQVVTEVQEEIL